MLAEHRSLVLGFRAKTVQILLLMTERWLVRWVNQDNSGTPLDSQPMVLSQIIIGKVLLGQAGSSILDGTKYMHTTEFLHVNVLQ